MRKRDAVGDWNKLLGRYKAARCAETLLYPNAFQEHEASLEELRLYHSAVEVNVEGGVSPYALFDGYFKVLLSNFGSKGFANGIGYGVWRDSGYHRGGTAAVRIYMSRLHRYLDAPAAQRILDHDADYFAGGSDLLSESAEEERPLAELTQEETLDHFMECRSDEIAFVTDRGIAAARAELKETVGRLEGLGPLDREKYGESLARWLRVID
jgi:hypothetical protein